MVVMKQSQKLVLQALVRGSKFGRGEEEPGL